MPVANGMTVVKLAIDSVFMEKNIEIKINTKAKIIFLSNKNNINSIGVWIA